MQILKQSTATTLYVGPVLDSAGAAVTTAVVGDFRLVKNGTAATLSGATVTHDANGYYTIALTTGNTDTLGRLTLAVGNTAMSMATHRYTVLLASVFDALLTNATNSAGGLVTATEAITGLAGTIANTANLGTLNANVVSTLGAAVVGQGTVAAGATSTSVPTIACSPAGSVAGQFVGRVMIFTNATATASLRGVACAITASTSASTPTFTVEMANGSALPATPASGDTFIIT